MFPCTSHGDAALLELPRGGRRPAFLCYSTALLASLSLSFHTLLIYFYPCGCGCTGMPTPNTSARRNKWQSRRTKVIYHRAERAARRTASSTPTHAHAPCHTLYMLIKSPWTPFVLQAASIPFAPRVLRRLQAQTQTHVGMIKSSNSG